MTELEAVVLAVAVALGAAAGLPVPTWAVVGVVAAGTLLSSRCPRRGAVVLVIVVLAVVASWLGSRAAAGVGAGGRARRVSGTAELVAPPESLAFGTSIEVRLGARRYRALVTGPMAASIDDAAVGWRFPVTATAGPLRIPWDRAATRHLAGELRLRSIGRARPGSWWWRWAEAGHRVVADGLASLPPDLRALALGVILGDDGEQPEVQRHRFRVAGLAHLLAVSGQNVAFVLLVASPVLGRLPLGARWVASLLVLGWFALVARMEPSVLRAVAMAGVAATASWSGRYASGIRVLAAAVTGLLLIDPLLVWSTGFRLSVAASASLVTLAGPVARSVPGPRWFADIVGASVAAQVATAPLLVGWAGPVPLLGVVWNLLAVPVAGWLMVWGMTAVPVGGLLGAPVASWLAWPATAMAAWSSAVARVGSWSWWPRLGPVAVAAGGAGVLAWVVGPWCWDRWPRLGVLVRPVVGVAAVVVAVDLVVLAGRPETMSAGSVRWWSAGGATVVDLGSRPTGRSALSLVARSRRPRVDVVIVTGGGSNAVTAVWELRQVVDVGVVLAADPAEVRDARPLEPGVARAGGLIVVVAVEAAGDDRRWHIDVRGVPP